MSFLGRTSKKTTLYISTPRCAWLMFLTTQDSAMCPLNPGRSTTSYFDKISISDPYDSTLINWSRCPDKQPSKFFPSFHWSLVACAPAAGFRSPSSNSLAGEGQQVIRCAIWTDDHKGVFLFLQFDFWSDFQPHVLGMQLL